jgi:molybdopterin/thiamine biosynthesis adenylyltransferase
MLTQIQKNRYQRHLIIPGFSEEEQLKLSKSSVLVIGAGGLGSPVLQYLCAAGVGTLGIVDNDKVSLSNLQRQVLYTEGDIGKAKAELAAQRLKANNSACKVLVYNIKWIDENAEEIARNFDLIIDCTDNFQSRISSDEVSKKLIIPFVYGAINEWEGQVAVFNYAGCKSYCEAFNFSKDKLPKIKSPIGVLGVTSAVIGSLQATEAIKIITGQGEVLAGKMLHMNLKTNRSKLLEL